jgi:hypothetical protein
MVHSLIYEPRKLKATDELLTKIYDNARLGLKGDNLAIASGVLPVEYRQLCQFDPAVEQIALRGYADAEAMLSRTLHTAAEAGDVKVALDLLKHTHGWVAKQQINLEVDQRISITEALNDANSRVQDAGFEVVETTDEKIKRLESMKKMQSLDFHKTIGAHR